MTPFRLLSILVLLTATTAIGLFFYISSIISTGMPSLEDLENPKQNLASQVFSQDGELLDQFFKERRVILGYKDLPQDFINALIATEDRRFWKHWGVHLERIFKAGIKTVFMGKKEGASTITQQLSRNLYLDQSPTLARKIREAATAIEIESRYTKQEILGMYANTVNFGRGAYGIYMAAKLHFNKKPNELTTAECAYLVGLLKAPTNYDARFNYDKALMRRNTVLYLMKDQKYITKDDYYALSEEPILFSASTAKRSVWDIAPHFVENIRKFVTEESDFEEYDLYTDGLKIRTTLDSRIQKHLNESVEEHLRIFQQELDKKWNWGKNKKLLDTIAREAVRRHPAYRAANKNEKSSVAQRLLSDNRFMDSLKNALTTVQCGVVVLEVKSGRILGMAGASPKFMEENPDAKYSLNHVSSIRRQPGSSVKPFVYAMSVKNGMSPFDRISCGPFRWINPETQEVWAPKSGTNDCPDESYTMTLEEGLRKSVNSVAARLITTKTTPSEVKRLLEKAGISSPIQAYPALALGAGGEFSPLELTSAYGALANDGYYIEPYYVTEIEDNNGNKLFAQNSSPKFGDALDKDVAHITTIMMRGVVDRGTAARVRRYFKNVEAAGKTGTTNDNADAWFMGYTPELICGVWVGFDDQRITFDVIGNDGQGGRAAAPIWAILMDKIYADPLLPYKKQTFGYSYDSMQLFDLGEPESNPVFPKLPN